MALPADVRLYLLLGHRHHGYGRGRGEPVGLVVAAGVVADLVGRAVEEGDGAEPREARARLTWRHKGGVRRFVRDVSPVRGFLGVRPRRRVLRRTEVLVVRLLLSLHEEQAVSVPQLGHALGTHGHLGALAVLHQRVADAAAAAHAAGGAGPAGRAGGTWRRRTGGEELVFPGRRENSS